MDTTKFNSMLLSDCHCVNYGLEVGLACAHYIDYNDSAAVMVVTFMYCP
jgi:hypothetical protein